MESEIDDIDDSDELSPPSPSPEDEEGRAEYRTLANGYLSPRHRRFCQLVAEGRTGPEIKTELGYSTSRVTALKGNHLIRTEIDRLTEKIYEETISTRLKSFSESALNNISMILNDKTNRMKTSEKMALSQWVIEKIDGKATQKTDIGENLLGVLMDRLDSMKSAGGGRTSLPVLDVTPSSSPNNAAPYGTPETALAAGRQEKDEEELLADWGISYTAAD